MEERGGGGGPVGGRDVGQLASVVAGVGMMRRWQQERGGRRRRRGRSGEHSWLGQEEGRRRGEEEGGRGEGGKEGEGGGGELWVQLRLQAQ